MPQPAGDGAVSIEGRTLRTFRQLVDFIVDRVQDDSGHWAGRAIGIGTVNAFVRRLYGAIKPLEHLIRADLANPARHRIALTEQVTVVDLHNLNDRAKRFVVGVTLRRTFEEKERSGTSRPLLFVVLDELNKYAPGTVRARSRRSCSTWPNGDGRSGSSSSARSRPRRRWSGASWPTPPSGSWAASTPPRRPDPSTGSSPGSARQRATILRPGSMFVDPAGAAGPVAGHVPVPRLGDPGGRGRRCAPSARTAAAADRVEWRGNDPGPAAGRSVRRVAHPMSVRLLHTADWHVGRTLRGRSRTEEHEATLDALVALAEDERVDLVVVAGDLFDTAAPTPEAERLVYRTLLRLADGGPPGGGHLRQPRPSRAGSAPWNRCWTWPGSTSTRSWWPPTQGGVLDLDVNGTPDPTRPAAVAVPPPRRQRRRPAHPRRRPAQPELPRPDAPHRRAAVPTTFDGDAVNLVVGHLTAVGRHDGRRRTGRAHRVRLRRAGHDLPAHHQLRRARSPPPPPAHRRAGADLLLGLAVAARLR